MPENGETGPPRPGSSDSLTPTQFTVPAGESARAREQLALDFDDPSGLTTTQRFEIFDQANPQVRERLVEMCDQWRASTGGQRLGIRTLWEAMRWDIRLRTRSDDYKLNDHFTSFYVRLIALHHPELGEMFEMRRSPEADEWIEKRRAA